MQILSQLPISVDADDSSTRTLSNCCQTNSQLRAAAILSSVWEPHYRARYTVADPEREAVRKGQYGGDWRLMFYVRRRLDSLASKLLDEIIKQRSGRASKARKLCLLSLDVWNALDCEARCALPEKFYTHGDRLSVVAVIPANCALTRRYWAKKVQGVIARHRAMGLWAHLRLQGPDVLSFEDVLASLSTFFGHTSLEVECSCTSVIVHGSIIGR